MDKLVMFIAAALVLYWIYRGLYNWLHTPRELNKLILGTGAVLAPDDENVLFLESQGYTVTSGKHRIPIDLELDETPLQSRIYVDYIAEKDGLHYAVKVQRERMQIEWTGSGLRDKLFVYALLLPQLEGILVMDLQEGKIRKVIFQLENL